MGLAGGVRRTESMRESLGPTVGKVSSMLKVDENEISIGCQFAYRLLSL